MIQYFLVQVSLKGSKDILYDNMYVNDKWRKKRKDGDHGKVNIGDIIIVYFTGRSIMYPREIRYIYQVEKISDLKGPKSIFYLKKINEITPITYESIKDGVYKEILDKVFLNCGFQGFNIKRIYEKAYKQFISYNINANKHN